MIADMSIKERRLFIANRGEIALRIEQTAALFPRPGSEAAHSTRFVPLAIYTPEEKNAAHVVALPPAQRIALSKSGPAAYLDAIALADLAKQHDAWGVAPGYGFLSESADFAAAVEERGMVWVGPRADQLAELGDKIAAKELAQHCRVPILQGTAAGRAASLQDVRLFAKRIKNQGVKMIIKALNGGGGRAMRVVELDDATWEQDLTKAFEQCQREAKAAFGDERVYAEQFLENAKHIEVQVIGDGTGDVAHMWERECSVQRRHQKLVEIAPCPSLPDGASGKTRQRILDAALRMAKEARYSNLGTFEFLYSPQADEFFFMEVNPRIQVEHTITEQVTGFDLVALQLQVALGAKLRDLNLGQEAAPLPFPRQTSIQVRINAEKFLDEGSVVPTAGSLSTFSMPTGPGVRVDTAAHSPRNPDKDGRFVQTPFFDSLLAKVIVTAPTYRLAVKSASERLAQTQIVGVDTNIGLLRAIIDHDDLAGNSRIHTRWTEEKMTELQSRAKLIGNAAASEPIASSAGDTGQGDDGGDLAPDGCKSLCSPLAGMITQILVDEASTVQAGQEVALIESMKMEHVVRAQQNGTVRKVIATKGRFIGENATIFHFEPSSESHGEEEAAKAEKVEDINTPRPDLGALLDRRRTQSDESRKDAIFKRHEAGFLTARENVALLADPDTFIEFGDLAIAAQRGRTDVEQLMTRTSNDGVVTGWASVNGALYKDDRARQLSSDTRCALCIYDYMVLAGTQGHFHHLKLDRIFRSVLENPAPLILYAEGGGGRPGDVDLMNLKVGGLDTPSFALMAAINARGYPAIGLANGYTFAGNAALLGTCHIIVATEGGAKGAKRRGATSTGMGGPAMIEGGGLGREKPENVGPVETHRLNGDYDVIVPTEREAAELIKKLLTFFQGPLGQDQWHFSKDVFRLRTALPKQRARAYEVRSVIESLVDDDSFVELGADWGTSLVTGFARIAGQAIGMIASSVLSPLGGAIDADSARKATRHVRMLTSTRAAHLVVLCDTPGFMVGPAAEKQGGLRAFADFFAALQAFQDGSSGGRIFGVTLRKAYGLGAQGLLGGSTLSNFFSVAWPQGEFAGMGIEGAVRLGMRKELEAVPEGEERDNLFASLVDVMYERGKAINTAMIGEIDTVIDPAETRAWLVNGLRSVRPRIPTWKCEKRAHSSHL